MKIKFNLGWILAIAGAAIMAAMGFMSFYYQSEGKLLLPCIVCGCLLVLPILVDMALVAAKECRRPFYFHKEAVKELTMLVAMLILCMATMPLVDHFFTVNSRAGKIAEAVADQRRQLDGMQVSYGKHVDDRVKRYRDYLEEVKTNRYRDMGTYERVFPNGDNDIDMMTKGMRNKLELIGLSDSIMDVSGSGIIRWWELPSVMENAGTISSVLDNNYELMTSRDHNFTDDNMAGGDYWSYSYTTVDDLMANFTSKAGFVSNLWTVLSVLVGYFLILLPYFATVRDSRSKGLIAELRNDSDDDSSAGPIGSL